jgi:hypothetical protein
MARSSAAEARDHGSSYPAAACETEGARRELLAAGVTVTRRTALAADDDLSKVLAKLGVSSRGLVIALA